MVAQQFEELIAELIGVLNPSLPDTTKDDCDGEMEVAFCNYIRCFWSLALQALHFPCYSFTLLGTDVYPGKRSRPKNG